MDPEIRRKIDQVKIDMMDESAGTIFFSSLLTQLQIVIDDTMPTAWTDAISIGLNPDLVKKATVDELKGVFMHELGHVIYEHIEIALENKEWLDHKVHNEAGDHHINLRNRAAGFILPHWIKPLEDPKYKGWSTMKIYNDLIANPPPKSAPQPSKGGMPCGMGSDVRLPSGMSKSEHKEHVISTIVKASMQAEMMGEKGIGSIPGHIKRIVKQVTSPKLPWPMILANFMTSYAREDYSMRRPNRRYMPEFYLPSLHSESFGHMIIASDVSGSISMKELDTAMAETRYIYDTIKPESLRLISFDTEIRDNEMFKDGDSLPDDFELHGGGGTNVVPVLKYVRDEDPKLCIIFTDGHFTPPTLEHITGDIFWVIKGNKNFKATKGTVIHME